jgi:hypothetical protein
LRSDVPESRADCLNIINPNSMLAGDRVQANRRRSRPDCQYRCGTS